MNIVNQEVENYINRYYVEIDKNLKELRKYAEEKGIPVILRDTEMLIISLLKIKKPKRILEVGTAIGYSALVMATILPDCTITTIDNDIRGVRKTKEKAKEMGVDHRIKVIHGDGSKVLGEPWQEVVLPEGQVYDFVFIDGGKSRYREFWQGSKKLSGPNSIILCDNVLMKAMVVDDKYDTGGDYKTSTRKMRDFIDFVMNVEGVNTSLLPVGDGVTISYIE